ncbi:MAG: aromatic-ring-hydroxylating dioxygenase subunit beta [Betaproteobacteria bacterium]|nr:MAG: aromatic-ring-hydroxylating dioxygenase subunit beta [Betaproteobacteria bacterium]TMI44482.1 MAG: aromatic-ring-hydroxylating dioxygenase subunit beta [Betaproteobacteria bacterium]
MNRLYELMAEYAMALDEDRLEDWVELFDEDCDYRIVTRENVEQGLPNVLMWCDNKNMLRDRVESYRNVNLYNPHYDRHVIGPLRFTDKKDSIFCFEAGYSLFQTSLEGESRLFSVGRYRVEARVEGNLAKLRSVTIIADTGLVPSLLATPI